MKITKSQKRLIIILGLVLCYAVIDIIINLDQYKTTYFGSDESKSQSSNLMVKSKQELEIKVDKKPIKLTWQRDPFKGNQRIVLRKKEKKQRKAQELFLQAITYSGKNSLVIINDKILRVDDIIGEYRVQKIYKDKVKLTKFGHTFFLKPN